MSIILEVLITYDRKLFNIYVYEIHSINCIYGPLSNNYYYSTEGYYYPRYDVTKTKYAQFSVNDDNTANGNLNWYFTGLEINA